MSEKMKGKELVSFARSKIGTPYVYGAKQKTKNGIPLTQANFNYLREKHPQYVPHSDSVKVGKVCVDCSGLISWACGLLLSSAQWMAKANVKKPIQTIADAPVGALVWMKGHIGIYSGVKNGQPYYIAADGSKYGVREVPLSKNRFTHWILVENVFDYDGWQAEPAVATGEACHREDDEMVVKDKVIVNGKEHEVEMIRKDGITYIKTRDIAEVLGLEVSSRGKVPVLTGK